MKIIEAFTLAASLHEGQTDKAGRPYIEHLVRVFLLVTEAGGTPDQQIAALLHDSIEDGLISEDGLKWTGVPESALELILALTRKEGQNYSDYINEIKKVPGALLPKLCDLKDNTDERRLATLSRDVATRLRKRYEKAITQLTQ